MRPATSWVLGLAAAGIAGAVWLLAAGVPPDAPGGPGEAPGPARAGGPRLPAPAPLAPPTAPEGGLPPAQEPDDPEWITRPLKLPAGKGALTGAELIAAVEGAGRLRFRGRTEADLAALRQVVFADVDRAAETPYAAMMGWLKEAGYEVEVSWPHLVVRRRSDEDFAGR